MSTYYLIKKQDFTSLIRHGTIPITEDLLVPEQSQEKPENDLLEKIKSLPHLLDDQDFLVLKLNEHPSEAISFSNVSEIIPLTQAAKRSFEKKFDEGLQFEEPKFPDLIDEAYQKTDFYEMKKGPEMLWEILGSEKNKVINLLEDEHIEDVCRYRRNGKKSFEISNEPFYVHLLVYDRFEIFPKSDLGYLYDVGQVVAHSKGKPTFEGSDFHKFLQANRDNLEGRKLSEIFAKIDHSEETNGLRNYLIDESSEIRLYSIAALYLKLKEEMRESDDLAKTSLISFVEYLPRCDDQLAQEVYDAIYLFGLFFGQGYFYRYYYNLFSSVYDRSDIDLPFVNQASTPDDKPEENGVSGYEPDNQGLNQKELNTESETVVKRPENVYHKIDELLREKKEPISSSGIVNGLKSKFNFKIEFNNNKLTNYLTNKVDFAYRISSNPAKFIHFDFREKYQGETASEQQSAKSEGNNSSLI
jgi:hypothetical protein